MKDFPYNDILNMKYPNPEIEADFPDEVLHHAQFAPFAALTGYDDAVEEVARLTEEEIELTEDEILSLDKKLRDILAGDDKNVKITYFAPDEKKSGGAYQKKSGVLKKVKEYERELLFDDGSIIKLDKIIQIEKGE